MNRSNVTLMLALIFIFITRQSSGQGFTEIKLPRAKKSYFLTAFDSTAINPGLVNKVTANLGFSEFRRKGNSITYKAGMDISGVHFTTFSKFTFNNIPDSKLKIGDSLFSVEPDKPVYIYGFTSFINEGNRANKNFSKLLMSAYLQEYDHEYANDPANFTPLAVKEKAEFRKRTWINMGYGMNYLAADNPFMGSKSFNVRYLYVWEALHYIAIFGGPFLGKTTEDKILISFTGLGGLIAQKTFMNLVLGNRYLKINRRINESGYKVPTNLDY